jgi:hypothetical protein
MTPVPGPRHRDAPVLSPPTRRIIPLKPRRQDNRAPVRRSWDRRGRPRAFSDERRASRRSTRRVRLHRALTLVSLSGKGARAAAAAGTSSGRPSAAGCPELPGPAQSRRWRSRPPHRLSQHVERTSGASAPPTASPAAARLRRRASGDAWSGGTDDRHAARGATRRDTESIGRAGAHNTATAPGTQGSVPGALCRPTTRGATSRTWPAPVVSRSWRPAAA